jgi:predicted DNA-binding transcriptional regulator AlpA
MEKDLCGDRILRKPELRHKSGPSDATIYQEEKAGRFPQRIRLGANAVGCKVRLNNG